MAWKKIRVIKNPANCADIAEKFNLYFICEFSEISGPLINLKVKKVLIALDYGPTAQQVAEAGYALAQSTIAEAVLLHVTAEPAYYSSTAFSPMMGFVGYTDIDYLQPESIANIKKASVDFLEKTREYLGDNSIEVLVKEGDSAEAIIEAAKETASDVIVLGSHSRKWLEAIVMGSVTEKVLRHTTVPLFIVPTKK